MVTTRPKKMVDSLWSNVKKIEWTQNETRGERFNIYYVLFANAKNLGDDRFFSSSHLNISPKIYQRVGKSKASMNDVDVSAMTYGKQFLHLHRNRRFVCPETWSLWKLEIPEADKIYT